MPKGNYDNNVRKARYARLRGMGIPRSLAMSIRDWQEWRYNWFLIHVRDWGLDVTLGAIKT